MISEREIWERREGGREERGISEEHVLRSHGCIHSCIPAFLHMPRGI